MMQLAFLQKIGYEGQSITFEDLPALLKRWPTPFHLKIDLC